MRIISLERLESILCNETAVIAPEDVELLMEVVRTKAEINASTEPTKEQEQEILRTIIGLIPHDSYLYRWLNDSQYKFGADTKSDMFCEAGYLEWGARIRELESQHSELFTDVESRKGQVEELTKEARYLERLIETSKEKLREIGDTIRRAL